VRLSARPGFVWALIALALAGLDSPVFAQSGSTSHSQRELFHLRDIVAPEESLQSWVGQWLNQPNMLGDWSGLRSALARFGIVPTVARVSDVQGNPIGGEQQALREFDNLYRGLIPGRANDVTGFAVIYGSFSGDLRRSERLDRRPARPPRSRTMSWCSNGRTASRSRAGSPCSPTCNTSSGPGAPAPSPTPPSWAFSSP